ncbi:Cell wall assembly regulator, partial [Cryomyces antarcticus]
NFSEGLPPPPPVAHSWKRIERWAEDNYEELFENLCEGCTQNDVNELEHELDCTLPMEVRESLQVHDGQERGGRPTGMIFGCMLLDCEEIVQEWQNWRKVNEEYLTQHNIQVPRPPTKAFAGASSSSSTPPPPPQQPGNSLWRQDLLARQDSQPPNAVQKAYAHPAWIPLARDWGGNNIAVDLAPGPTGKWGQVIIMGRDYDCKYVIARSWAAFLATVADDLSTDKWWVEEDSKELKLREFKQTGVEPAYLDILRWRCDQKYGRKQPKKGQDGNLRVNSNVTGNMNGFSPYGSPTSGNEDR